MELSDPAASRAVLIGVSAYTELPDLPAVARNLTGLRGLLTDPTVWGLPGEHCHVLGRPADNGAILRAVDRAARQARDTLIVYYAGHGLINPRNDELHLALPDSDPQFADTGLTYPSLRDVIQTAGARVQRKIVILDCCYSGRAMTGAMGADVADRTITEGTHVLAASGPTERAWSPPGEDHTAFTGELLRVLHQGIPGGPALLTTNLVYHHIDRELRSRNRPRPQQYNRNAGGDIPLAHNRAVSDNPPTPFPYTRHPWWRRLWSRRPALRSWLMIALVIVGVLAATAVTAAIINWTRDRVRVQPDLVPAALHSCKIAGTLTPGATNTYACADLAGRAARLDLYRDRKASDAAYQSAIGNAAVLPGTGDCGTTQDAEHRYPVTGPARGRVLCFTDGPTTSVVWTDDGQYTVARVDAPTADLSALRDSWTGATAAVPAFPTAEEKKLTAVSLATDCVRAGVEDLDDFAGAIAAVTCSGTGGQGAQSVSYFQFETQARLVATMAEHLPGDRKPTAKGCQDGEAPRFTGGRRYDLRSVSIGLLLCRPDTGGNLIMEWSVEPMLIAGRAVGVEVTELTNWWRNYRGPAIQSVVDAINAQGEKFPNPAEKDLLMKIPPRSRKLCTRPSGEYRGEHVGTSAVSAGVVCGPGIGPAIVFYYQFENVKELRENYSFSGKPPGNCLTSRTSGESAYSRGGATGRLKCEIREGFPVRTWTDERRLIQVYAFQGRSVEAMADWWENDAGPL